MKSIANNVPRLEVQEQTELYLNSLIHLLWPAYSLKIDLPVACFLPTRAYLCRVGVFPNGVSILNI